MRFKSKVDTWYWVVVWGWVLATAVLLFAALRDDNLVVLCVAVLFVLLGLLLVIPIAMDTWYELGARELRIHCGLFMDKRILYTDIISVEPTRDVVSSPAPSLDRLAVQYFHDGGRGLVLISPREKEQFLRELLLRMRR